ncbi:hypothetical protein Q5752_000152 [Cryptotrichosporon argae]
MAILLDAADSSPSPSPSPERTPAAEFLTAPPPLKDTITLECYYGISSPWAYLGAREMERIAVKYGLTIHLKPITVIAENGGIRLKIRHPARQAYHALDLVRTAHYLGIPIKPAPKYYPQKAGDIELAAQAVIRVQRRFGVGAREALDFSFAVQQCIWWTEQGYHCDVGVLRDLALSVGVAKDVVDACVVDRRGNRADEAVLEWEANHAEAVAKGIFGTPNYLVNDEIFWGQDRLWMVERRIQELIAAGARPVTYA